jgi:hypothetical protein
VYVCLLYVDPRGIVLHMSPRLNCEVSATRFPTVICIESQAQVLYTLTGTVNWPVGWSDVAANVRVKPLRIKISKQEAL